MISVEGMQGFLTAIEKHIDSLHASQLEYFIELFENKQELIDSEIKDISAKKRLNKILSINIMKRFNQNLHNYNINQGYDLFPTEFLNKYKEVSMRKKDFDRREDNVIYDFEEGIWNYAQICSKDSHMQKYSTVYYNSLLVLIKKLYSSERNNILKRIFDKRRSLKKLKKINLNTFHSIKTKVTEIGVFIITYVNYDFDLFLIFLKNMTFLHKDELEILQKIQSEIHKRDEYLLEEFKETNNKIGDSKLTRREFLEQKFKEEDYYGIVAEKNEMCYIELDKRISELNKFLSN